MRAGAAVFGPAGGFAPRAGGRSDRLGAKAWDESLGRKILPQTAPARLHRRCTWVTAVRLSYAIMRRTAPSAAPCMARECTSPGCTARSARLALRGSPCASSGQGAAQGIAKG